LRKVTRLSDLPLVSLTSGLSTIHLQSFLVFPHMYGVRPLQLSRPQSAEPPTQKRSASLFRVSDLTSFWETKYHSQSAPSSPVLLKYCSTPSPARGMHTRRGPIPPAQEKTKISKTSRTVQPPRTSQAAQVLTNMADATYKVIGLSKKKGKPTENSDSDYQIQHSPRGEKEKYPDKNKSDDYYDDRLSRDSQLDSHLKELVSDVQESGDMGGFVTGAYDEQEGDDQEVTDEFYDEADKTNAVMDQPADINLAGDIYTPAAIEEMLGDWGADQTTPPPTRSTS
jgi:hypothetical protein